MAVSAFLDFKMQWEIWSDHWSFWSKITPKTFILFIDFIFTLFKTISIGAVSL